MAGRIPIYRRVGDVLSHDDYEKSVLPSGFPAGTLRKLTHVPLLLRSDATDAVRYLTRPSVMSFRRNSRRQLIVMSFRAVKVTRTWMSSIASPLVSILIR
jgi:hypothetical protein